MGLAGGLGLAMSNALTHNNAVIYAECAAIVVIAIGRIVLVRSFRNRQSELLSEVDLDWWETAYLIGSVATLGSIGIVAATSTMLLPDSVLTYIALMAAFGASLSVCTRNYSSLKVFSLAATACFVPVLTACVYTGFTHATNAYFGITIVATAIYALSIYLGLYLRRQHLEAITAARLAEINSHRFDLALKSMPAGLLLVGKDGSVIVINEQAKEMLNLHTAFTGVLGEAIGSTFAAFDTARIVAEHRRVGARHSTAQPLTLEIQTTDHRWLQCEISGTEHVHSDLLDEFDLNTVQGASVITLQEVTEKVLAHNALRDAACTDKLTGIANRTHWEALVDASTATLEDNSLVAMCILDVDRFKLINDTLGHHIGDEVIAGVAQRLKSVSDDRLIIGRVGGDEFVVFAPRLQESKEVFALFDKVFSAISTTYVIAGHFIDVKCSGGVVCKRRDQFDRIEDMKRADMSLYKIKKNVDKCWMLFDDALEAEYQTARRIKSDLKRAIESNELQVVYQPIFNAAGTEIISTEALCRWEHGETGHIAPSKFVMMAEEIGIIGKLTEYVLRTACRDCKAWGADIPVAVNLSAIDLARNELVEMINSALADFKLPPSKLCVEVTENVFVKDFRKTAETLKVLREIGVKTSLDDFGTGYSSLSYLSQLPLNRVKIDRSFVIDVAHDPKSQKLFRAVVSLAKELDFEIIVEGVESQDQLDFITNVKGVDMIQGHIYSQTFTAAEMTDKSNLRSSGSKTTKPTPLKLVSTSLLSEPDHPQRMM